MEVFRTECTFRGEWEKVPGDPLYYNICNLPDRDKDFSLEGIPKAHPSG